MYILLFFTFMNGNAIPLSKGELDSFDTRDKCVEKAERMRKELNPKIGYKCVEVGFSKD